MDIIQKQLDILYKEYEKWNTSPGAEEALATLERMLEFQYDMPEKMALFNCGWISCDAHRAFYAAGRKRLPPSGWITREDKKNRKLGGPRRAIVRRSRRIAHTK